MSDIMAIIPARSGSKGVVDKNVKMLNGHLLIFYSIYATCLTAEINRFVVSTDSEKYTAIARKFGAEFPFLRPGELAEDHLAIFKDLNQKQFSHFEKYLNDEAMVLEVGFSFYGIMRQVAESVLAQFHEVEPKSKEDTGFVEKLIPKIKLYSDSFEKVDLPKGFYDLEVSFEVLEHEVSPKKFLEKKFCILKQGGRVNFKVPNYRAVLLHYYQNFGYN